MNLSAYDIIKGINHNGTWIDPQYKKLYSREIRIRKYYAFSKTYNPETDEYTICLILADYNPLPDDSNAFTKLNDRFKPLKVSLVKVWNDIFHKIECKQNINLIHIQKEDDCDVYQLDI